jgi:hypothetical protein
MKGHVSAVLVDDGIDISNLKEIVKAMELHKENCEGQDCSFIQMEKVV